MKKYLIRIESGRNCEFTTINGDSLRPFQIAHNLWNYTTPGHAGQRLEKLARAWEDNGHQVTRIYGSVGEMPTTGNEFNLKSTLIQYGAINDTYINLVKKHYPGIFN